MNWSINHRVLKLQDTLAKKELSDWNTGHSVLELNCGSSMYQVSDVR